MFKPPNSNQLGIVDEGKFNFPTSSSPKGEGVGKINCPNPFPNFDSILEKFWNELYDLNVKNNLLENIKKL